RYVTSGLQLNRSKSLVTQKRYEMERMILLITNRKSVIAFQDFGVHFTYDATWRRKRRFVTSGLEQNCEKSLITEKRYEMERKLLVCMYLSIHFISLTFVPSPNRLVDLYT